MDALIDLDAARREAGGEAIPVRFNNHQFQLPAELPADVLRPLMDGDLDGLFQVLASAIAGTDEKVTDALMAVLVANPALISQVVRSLWDTIGALFGPEQWAQFQAGGPSIPDIWRLLKGLAGRYGVGLGEALASLDSSELGGPTSRPTSPPAASTPAVSGSPLGIPG